MIKTALITLGCCKNQVDSEYILGDLKGGPLVITTDPSQAELIIVNTCGFIDQAKEESIDAIFAAAQLKENNTCRALVVCGCMAQRYGDELGKEIPEIDAILGLDRYHELEKVCMQLLGEAAPCKSAGIKNKERILLSPPHYAYIKVSEGCDNHCSYCAIPLIRGPHRSRLMEEVLEEAHSLVKQGVVEINLIGQDTTLYGLDIYGKQQLHILLKELNEIEGLRWIRLLYTHPAHWYPELIQWLARLEKVVKYADIPLQHVSDRLLSAMNRRIDRWGIEQLVKEVRTHIPDITLRTTFIVGLPGEREEDFSELLHFVEQTRFQSVGAFPYSREEGTPASSFPKQVAEKVKQRRLDDLMSLQQGVSLMLNRQLMGKTIETLIEGPGEDGFALKGRTSAQAPELDGQVLIVRDHGEPGSFVPVRITDATAYDLIGEIA